MQYLPQDEGFVGRILHEVEPLGFAVDCEVAALGVFGFHDGVALLAQQGEHDGHPQALRFLCSPFQRNEIPFPFRYLLQVGGFFAEGVDCIQEQDVLYAIQDVVDVHLAVELQWIV